MERGTKGYYAKVNNLNISRPYVILREIVDFPFGNYFLAYVREDGELYGRVPLMDHHAFGLHRLQNLGYPVLDTVDMGTFFNKAKEAPLEKSELRSFYDSLYTYLHKEIKEIWNKKAFVNNMILKTQERDIPPGSRKHLEQMMFIALVHHDSVERGTFAYE